VSTVVCSTVQPIPNKIFNVKNSESESESSESNSDELSDEFPDDFENEKKENDNNEEEDDDENKDKISKRNPCSFCEKQFSYKSWLKCHLTVHIKTFACNYCHEIFMKKYKLQVHTGPIKYKCSDCNASKTNLKKHHDLKHNLNRKEISCVLCKTSFSCGRNLWYHMIDTTTKHHINAPSVKWHLIVLH